MSMRLRSVVAAIASIGAFGVLLHAQTPTRDAAAAQVPTGTAVISGVVVDGDGQPLRRVTVTVAGDQRYRRSTVTDATGRFAFASLPAGRFTVTASRAGYPPISLGARRPYRPGAGVLLADGQQMTNVTLTLHRGAALAGTVYDENGAPMPGVPVMAWEVRPSLSGERVLDFPATGGEWVVSDDRGRFRVFGLPPGEYTIGTAWHFHGSAAGDVRVPTADEFSAAFAAVSQPATTPRPGARTDRPVPQRYDFAAVFHPSSTDPMQATTIALGPGDVRDGVDLHMVFRPLSRIEGVVSSPDGERRAVSLVLARRASIQAQSTQTHTSTQADGSFVLGSLAPGDYTVLAFSEAAAGRPPMWALEDVRVITADPVKLAMTLQPAMTIAGRVRFEGTTTKPAELPRTPIALVNAPGTTTTSNSSTTSVGPDGSLTITGVTPGRFFVRGSIPASAGGQPWRLARVIVDGQDRMDLPIEISPGSAPSLEVVFTDTMTELTGTLSVPPGAAASDYFVVAIAADERYWESSARRASVRTDASGRFTFRGLPAGEYRLAVTTDLVQRDLSDAAALRQLMAQSIPASLAPGERKTVDIKIAR